jgi:DNA-binding CsgD family transcriptional regulator
MLEGCDAGDCADRFGVSRTTIRSQLAALFDKTGRRRQATLLVLLAAVAATPPMAAARLEAPRVAANAA